MSTKIYTAQKSRPYKVEVFGLQDDYIGTLQSFADLSIGRVQDPKVTLSGDGTQEFTCSIPRFYINPKTNEKIINPRWEDIKNGVLAENTRVLKVFVIEEGETKVYPFIVDEIIDKRDSHFSVYKEITASGLAFAELGKVGLRLELNKDVVEADYKKDKNTVATLDYWLDKVFPNEKDENGAIIRWLTPWSYDIRMDWSNYSDMDDRETNKMYDDIQVDKWEVTDGKLIPAGTSKLQEKARYINSDKGSNKYNITQTIAETFGIFCVYEYKCEANGQFVKTYVDESGRNMTGRTAVFYNRAIKTDNPFTLDYQKNLQSISRTCDSTEVYTKLFVDPIQSDTMTDGYVTIANTAANPLMDEFILNFDYLYSKGSITEYQKDFIDKYSVETHEINEELRNKGELINLLTVEINDKKAEKAGAEKSVSAIQEELTHYQTLRDNDVTNTPVVKDKNNSYSVAFVKDNDKTSPYYRADLRLEGILSSSINGYKNYKYEEAIFTSKNLISSQDFKSVAENDKNMYVVLDEDGYAIGLYTGYAEWFKADDLENDYIFDTGYIVYLALQYSPHNKYVEVCNRFERMIAKNKKQIAICDNFIESKQVELDELIASQSELLARKNSLNQKLEYIMGPALREGHWSAEDYEDIGRKTETTVKAGDKAVDDVSLVFDTELFDGEEKGYYYTSAEDANNDTRTYYDYIDISSYITSWRDKNPEDLVIHLTQPEFRYTVTESQINGLAAGNYFILYNMIKYYFSLSQALETGNILRIQSFSGEADTPIVLQMSTDNGVEWTNIAFEAYNEEKNYANLTDIFEGLNKYLSTYKIYPNAGFIYGFISQEKIAEDSTDKTTTAVKPVLLLNNPEINYSIYKQIGYSFGNEGVVPSLLYKTNEELVICYPRIVVTKNNVNYDDDLLTITEENVKKALVKFEDYSVLLRNGQPRFNLKVTKNTTPYALLNKNYTIAYRISQANEMLYRDALEVARENSRPRFSYDVSVAQLPDTVESYELGQLGYINDSALGVKAAKGYISSITLVLDSPKDDEIQIQNYKTKFEDLFATITASSEAMKTNQQSYDIAASIINPSTGSIQGSILQDSFNNNKVELTYSNTQVHIDDTDGITLTNTEPYSNGVYGQVVMRGGGIFLSNTVDSNYNRIWTTGITPNGINASTITTGQLDANLVRIFAGNNVAFQWNSEGIYAYKRDENNQFLSNTYVRYSDKGLQYLDDGFTAVDLGWNGLAINTQGGSLTLTGKDGLVVYDGLQNDSENPTNHLIRIGKFEEDENVSYGMRLYKPITIGEDTSYTETLITSNDGHLWLKDYIEVGNKTNSDDGVSIYGAGVSGLVNSEDDIISGGGANLGGSSGSTNTGGAGLSGVGDPNKSVRFWAGSSFDTRDVAPFRVLQDGTCYATSLYIGGNSSINGSSVNDLTAAMNNYNSKLVSSNGNIYNRDNPTQTILFCKALRNGVEMAQLPDGYVLTLEYCQRSTGDWFIKYTSLVEGSFNVTVDMDEEYSYRSVLTYVDNKGIKQIILGDTLSFIAVTNGEQGDSIARIEEQYAASSSMTITPTEWKDTLEETGFSQTKPYLWCKEVYVYTNETTSEPMYRVMAVYGQKGVGIEKIANYYLVTNLKTGVKIEGNAWILVGPEEATKEIPNTTYFCPYLWHYEKILYTDGSFTNTSPRLIEVRGINITGVTNQYILSTSNNEILDQEGNARKEEDWKNSYEEVGSPSAEWPYLWSREVVNYDEAINYESGDKFKILSARLIATYGDGIVEIQEYYLLVDTNAAESLPTDWGEPNPTEVPVPNNEARFLWNKERRIYTNGDYKDTQPRIIGMYGEVGDDGRGVLGIIEEYTLSISSIEILPYNTGEIDENGEAIIIGGEENWTSTFTMPTKEAPFVWNREGIQYSDNEGEWVYSNPAVITSYVEDGRGIEKLENYYCIYHSVTGVIAGQNGDDYEWSGPDFSQEAIPVPTDENPYLWNYERIVWTEGEPTITEASVIGSLGISVDDVNEEYAIYNDNKNPPPDNNEEEIYWHSSLQIPTAEKPYLWIKETITYTSIDKEDKIFKRVIATYTENGRSINEIVNKYLITSDSYSDKEVLEIPLEEWDDVPGITTPETPYLWNREIIYYNVDDGNGGYNEKAEYTVTSPRVIGIHGKGEKGDDGNDGISIIDITEEYQYTETNIPQPEIDDPNWQKTLPSYTLDKPYFWIKETTYYSSIDEETGQNKKDSFVRLVGVNGQVKNIVNYYWANNSSTPPSLEANPLPPNANKDTWTETEQEATSENRFLWNCEVITYTVPNENNETSQIFGPILLGSYGEKGDTTYTWIKYSNVANPTSSEEIFDDPEGMTYMGIAYNQLVEKASDNPKDYKWSLIQGPVGNDAIVYEIVFSESSIKHGLIIPFTPNEVKVSIRKTEGTTITDITNELGTAEAHENVKYKLYYLPNPNYEPKQYLYSNTVINAQNCYELGEGYQTCICILEDSFGNRLTSNSIDFILNEELLELAKVEDGVIYADGGKLYAESVTSEAILARTITAGKIAANTITVNEVTSNFGQELNISSNTGIGVYVNANGVNTSSVTLDSNGIALKTGGSFTVDSGNFSVDDEGNVSLTGKITAESGSIGGWNIDKYGLYSGSGTTRVSLNSSGEGENANYAIWAGADEPQKTEIENGKTVTKYAPFAVTRDGRVYLTRIMALANETDTTPTEVNLSSSYWQIWTGYSHSVKTLKAEGDTLIIELYNGTSVNFKKAADGELWAISGGVGTPGFTVYYGERSPTNIVASMPFTLQVNGANGVDYTNAYVSASGYGNLGIGYVYNAGYTNATADELRENDYEEGYYIIDVVQNDREVVPLSFSGQSAYEDGYTNGEKNAAKEKVAITFSPEENQSLTVGQSTDFTAIVSYDGEEIDSKTITISAPTENNDYYIAGTNSVTISGSWDGNGTYTAKTSTGKEVKTSLSLSAAGGGGTNFSVYGLGNGVIQETGTVSGTLSGRYVLLKFDDHVYGQVPVSSVYNSGWNDCRNDCKKASNVYESTGACKGTLYYKNADGTYSDAGSNWHTIQAVTNVYTIPDPK